MTEIFNSCHNVMLKCHYTAKLSGSQPLHETNFKGICH